MPTRPTSQMPKKFVYRGTTLEEPQEMTALLAPHRGQRDALLSALGAVQAHYGYLPEQALRATARALGLPLSQIFGVATFYNLFTLSPPGRHTVRVCTGTACHVTGSAAILAALSARLGIGADETTPDGLITLQTVACVGACSLAPVLVVGEESHGRMSPEAAHQCVARLRAGERTTPKEVPA